MLPESCMEKCAEGSGATRASSNHTSGTVCPDREVPWDRNRTACRYSLLSFSWSKKQQLWGCSKTSFTLRPWPALARPLWWHARWATACDSLPLCNVRGARVTNTPAGKTQPAVMGFKKYIIEKKWSNLMRLICSFITFLGVKFYRESNPEGHFCLLQHVRTWIKKEKNH